VFGDPLSDADDIAPHALGRMYNLSRNVIVGVLLGPDNAWRVPVTDPGPGGAAVSTIVPTSVIATNRSEQAVMLADVDGEVTSTRSSPTSARTARGGWPRRSASLGPST